MGKYCAYNSTQHGIMHTIGGIAVKIVDSAKYPRLIPCLASCLIPVTLWGKLGTHKGSFKARKAGILQPGSFLYVYAQNARSDSKFDFKF